MHSSAACASQAVPDSLASSSNHALQYMLQRCMAESWARMQQQLPLPTSHAARAAGKACVPAEAFVVCQDFRVPPGFRPELLRDLLAGAVSLGAAGPASPEGLTLAERQLIPFLACGDISGWDADQSYDLPAGGYKPLAPCCRAHQPGIQGRARTTSAGAPAGWLDTVGHACAAACTA